MPPPIPLATYRVQLTPSFGFDQAAAAVPYLKALGVSHLYASPFLKARAGSTHGYDVVDYHALNPELGGELAFRRLRAELAAADIGLILDFVPNHMGVLYADNPWWLDVLEWGPQSPHATFFDIDWKAQARRGRGRVLVPILGGSYGEAIERGEIELRYDRAEGSFSIWYFEHRLPVGPEHYRAILRRLATPGAGFEPQLQRALLELEQRYRGRLDRDRAQALKAELAAISAGTEAINSGLRAYRPTPANVEAVVALHRLLEQQHYRLAYWRLAQTDLNYRRFFDINSLAGLCVEHPATFDAIHGLVARLIADGDLQGLRIDHIDGLQDPEQYFRRLQRLIRPGRASEHPFYIVVEKILGKREPLPKLAGVAGTTGYEWLNVISQVLLDPRGLAALDRTWRDLSGESREFDEILKEAKRHVLRNILGSEFNALTRLLARIAAGDYRTRDYYGDRLRAAFELFVQHFPVYRTYITDSGASPQDRSTIGEAIVAAGAEWPGSDLGIFDFLRDTLTSDLGSAGGGRHSKARVRRFASKAQQFTGPMMAKSLEDTAFYRYHRLLALNEVGGDPASRGVSIAEFHARMKARAATAPHGLTATATHDTKRGEDARARLLSLPELADDWAQEVKTWRELNGSPIAASGELRIPSQAHEYMLYQVLLGAWPLEGPDRAFIERMQAYAIKAVREGKQQSSWLAPDDTYEAGLRNFLQIILDPSRSSAFMESFGAFARRVALMGALKSLVQLTLKATLPGVPDFYQGTEFWDLSLVDPDNRRPVDFAARASALPLLTGGPDWHALARQWWDGRIKLALMCRLLGVRQMHADVFSYGDYRPLPVHGRDRDEILAFARCKGEAAVLVVAARFFGRSTDNGRCWPERKDWDAAVSIEGFSSAQDLMIAAGPGPLGSELTVRDAFKAIPVAVLQARCVEAGSTARRARSTQAKSRDDGSSRFRPA